MFGSKTILNRNMLHLTILSKEKQDSTASSVSKRGRRMPCEARAGLK